MFKRYSKFNFLIAGRKSNQNHKVHVVQYLKHTDCYKRADSDCGIVDIFYTLKPALIRAVQFNHNFWHEHLNFEEMEELETVAFEEFKKHALMYISEVDEDLLKDLYEHRRVYSYDCYSLEKLRELYKNSIKLGYGDHTMKPSCEIAFIHSGFVKTGKVK
ncbi:hypothetical protein ABK040_002281 [Willaertia magna]